MTLPQKIDASLKASSMKFAFLKLVRRIDFQPFPFGGDLIRATNAGVAGQVTGPDSSLLFMARHAHLRLPVQIVNVYRLRIQPQRVGDALGAHTLQAALVIFPDSGYALRPR